jgi:hypothetical protein
MLLFRPYLSFTLQHLICKDDALDLAITKCVSSAKQTIELIYDTFMLHAYFRIWYDHQSLLMRLFANSTITRFFNTTYVIVAASILLMNSQFTNDWSDEAVKLVEMAVELLDAMGESVAAQASADVVRRFIRTRCHEGNEDGFRNKSHVARRPPMTNVDESGLIVPLDVSCCTQSLSISD